MKTFSDLWVPVSSHIPSSTFNAQIGGFAAWFRIVTGGDSGRVDSVETWRGGRSLPLGRVRYGVEFS